MQIEIRFSSVKTKFHVIYIDFTKIAVFGVARAVGRAVGRAKRGFSSRIQVYIGA